MANGPWLLIEALYTTPKPPLPIMYCELKFSVASSRSWYENVSTSADMGSKQEPLGGGGGNGFGSFGTGSSSVCGD